MASMHEATAQRDASMRLGKAAVPNPVEGVFPGTRCESLLLVRLDP
jgi:hypothetical protein